MVLSDWIALGALVIAIISIVSQIISNTKSNDIQRETFRLSKKIDDFENRKGEILLLNIIGRYFVIQLNRWEPNGKMLKDKISSNIYISELKQLSNDFNELVNNPFYIKFIENHPDINLLILSLRRTIVERENSKAFEVNFQTFNFFYKAYKDLKIEIAGNKILEHQFFKTCDEAAEYLINEIPKLQPTKKPTL